MRLNPHSPSDNPMEQLFYCFGGDDGGGSGGGDGAARDQGRAGPAAGDSRTNAGNIGVGSGAGLGARSDGRDRSGGFDPGFDEGDVGDTGGFDPGFDAGDVGDTGGFDPGFDAGDTGDTGGFGGRDGTAGAAGSNIGDTDPFSDYGNIDQLTSFGYGPNIQSTDLPSQAEVSAAIAAGVPAVQAQTTGFTAPSVSAGLTGRAPGDMGGDTSIERDVFGTGEDEYSTQSIFDVDPTGLGLETPQERIAREKAENTRAAARAAAAERAKTASEQAQREALQRSLGIPERDIALQTQLDEAMAPERARQAEEDALAAQLGAEADANRAARESRPSDRGIESLMGGTVFGAPDVTGQAEDIGNNRSAAAPGINVNIGPVESQADVNRAADEALAATGLSTPTADIDITYSPDDAFSFTRDVLGVDQSVPQMSLAPESMPSQFDRQMRMGEVQGPMSMAPVEATRFSGVDMMRQADDVLGERAIDEAIFGDPSDMPIATVRAGMEIVNALESTFGGNQARKIADVANRPGGALVRDPASGEILGAVGPEENIRSAFMGAQDAVYVGDPRGYEQGVNIGTSILGPDTNVRDVGTQDPFTGQLEGRPGADYSPPVTPERGDGDDGQVIFPLPLPAEPDVPEEYVGRDIIKTAPYEPRAPVQYSYTGLPTLAPFVLRPSRTSNRDFIRPTYDFGGLGSLRRS